MHKYTSSKFDWGRTSGHSGLSENLKIRKSIGNICVMPVLSLVLCYIFINASMSFILLKNSNIKIRFRFVKPTSRRTHFGINIIFQAMHFFCESYVYNMEKKLFLFVYVHEPFFVTGTSLRQYVLYTTKHASLMVFK